MRDKKQVQGLVNLDTKQPFVYASGRYENEWNKITVALPLAPAPNSNVLVDDLRYDPTPFMALGEKELADKVFASWEERKQEDFVRLPVKQLQYNRCPAVAPLGVLAQGDGWVKVGIDEATVAKHAKLLLANPEFAERLRSVFERKREYAPSVDPEAQLYDGFLNDRDRLRVETVRNASERELADYHPEFADERLAPLLLHYKARNYPKTMSESELQAWEEWRASRLQRQLPSFMKSLQRLGVGADDNKQFMLQELQLWAESILPGEQE